MAWGERVDEVFESFEDEGTTSSLPQKGIRRIPIGVTPREGCGSRIRGFRRNPNLTAGKGIEEKTNRRTSRDALPRNGSPALPLSCRPMMWSRPDSNRRPGDYESK